MKDESKPTDTFTKLYKKHAMYKTYDELSNNFDTVDYSITDYKLLGLQLTNFMLSIINYKAPNVNTGLNTI